MENASPAKDAKESLELEILLVREFIDGADQTLIEDGHSELATSLDGLRKAVSERALTKAGYIVALARSRMPIALARQRLPVQN